MVNHYTAFVFEPSYCSDTITTVIFDTTYVTIQDTITTHVTDTTFVTVADSITVTDTLVIDAVLTDIAPPYNINTLKVYPNPARDHLFIHTGNYGLMAWYRLKITNELGVTVFETIVEEPLYELKLSEWTGLGLYFLQVFDPAGEMIEVRKIVLE